MWIFHCKFTMKCIKRKPEASERGDSKAVRFNRDSQHPLNNDADTRHTGGIFFVIWRIIICFIHI